MTGIALGAAALVLSLGALSGFQALLRNEILARTPQVEAELPAGADAAAAAAAARRLTGVTGVQVAVHGRGWLVLGGAVQPVEAIGFAGEVPASFPGAGGLPEGLYVDAGLAARWGLEPGTAVTVVSPRPTLTPLGPPQPRARALPLAGTFEASATPEDSRRVALPLAVADSLFGTPPRRLLVATDDLDRAAGVAAALAAALPAGSEVRTWREINRPLFFVLKLEKAMIFVAVSLIVLVATLALVADLALIIANKRAEIGMLGAMGATPGALVRAFLLLGALLAYIGLALGLTFGVHGAWLLDTFRLVPLPSQVYIFDYVPFRVQGGDVAAVSGLTVVLALAFSFYAARRVAALSPVEAMRR